MSGGGTARGGVVLVLVASSCFGTLGIFSKLFYDAGGGPDLLLFLRFVVTGPVIAALGLLLFGLPGRRTTLVGAGMGVFQFGVAYALFEGYDRAPVALVTLLFFSYPLMTVLAAAAIFGERLGLRRIVLLALALAGVALTIGIPDSATWVGIVLGLVAGMCVTALVISARFALTRTPLSPIVLVGLMFTSPAVGLALALPAWEPDLSAPGGAWGWAICAVLVSAMLPLCLFYTGVQRVPAGTVGLLSAIEPVVTVLLAYAVLGESLSGLQLLGGGLLLACVVALSLEAGRAVPVAAGVADDEADDEAARA